MQAKEQKKENEETSSTTISNIKLYNLVRDSLKSNASLVLPCHILKDSGAGRFQDQLFTDAIDIFIDERYETRDEEGLKMVFYATFNVVPFSYQIQLC